LGLLLLLLFLLRAMYYRNLRRTIWRCNFARSCFAFVSMSEVATSGRCSVDSRNCYALGNVAAIGG